MGRIGTPADLDGIFEALSHKHRREIIGVLGLQPCSIGQLAAMRELSLPAIHMYWGSDGATLEN
jgi:hypothetical protein